MSGQSRAVRPRALDRPYPRPGIAVCERNELRVTGDVGGHSHCFECCAGDRLDDRSSVGELVGVDTDDDIDLICEHGHAFLSKPGWIVGFRSGSEIGRTVTGHARFQLAVKLLIRPVTPPGRGRQPWTDKSL